MGGHFTAYKKYIKLHKVCTDVTEGKSVEKITSDKCLQSRTTKNAEHIFIHSQKPREERLNWKMGQTGQERKRESESYTFHYCTWIIWLRRKRREVQ